LGKIVNNGAGSYVYFHYLSYVGIGLPRDFWHCKRLCMLLWVQLMKWEYKDVDFETGLTYLALLNQFGDEGWELVLIDHQREYAIFKRPKTETLTEVAEWENHHCPPDTSIGDCLMLRLHYNNSHPEDSYYSIISHKTGAAIVVSFCPWCGEKI